MKTNAGLMLESKCTQLPRSARLLNRSRMSHCQLSNGSDSPKSTDSFPRSSMRTSSVSHYQPDINGSSDDLLLHDKSFRNALVQDVLHFKKQLLLLRRILQETEALNPFEMKCGNIFNSYELDTKRLEDMDMVSPTSFTTDDPLEEMADLRRQVVYLQGQVDNSHRIIRMQKNLIEKLESDTRRVSILPEKDKESVNIATQTDRIRPLAYRTEGLSRSKPECTSYTTYFPASKEVISATSSKYDNNNKATMWITAPIKTHTGRQSIISTTFATYNQRFPSNKRSPIVATTKQKCSEASKLIYKPVKITYIGDPMAPSSENKCS